jgi:hypothetical protein
MTVEGRALVGWECAHNLKMEIQKGRVGEREGESGGEEGRERDYTYFEWSRGSLERLDRWVRWEPIQSQRRRAEEGRERFDTKGATPEGSVLVKRQQSMGTKR